MADNVEVNAGSGGALIATDDDGTAQHQYVKLEFGADGVFTKVATGANALPVLGQANSGVDIGDVTVNNGVGASAVPIQDGGNTITVDGSVAVTNGGTFATQVDGAALTALQLIDDTVFVDDTATHTAATTKVLGIGAVATPTDGAVDANDIGMPAMSLDRRLHVDAQIVGQDAAVTVDGSGVTQPVSHAALTELAAAINASSQMDVNLAASNATVTVDLGVNNDVTVTSGTVDLGATDNAVLDAIAASVAAIDTDATTIIGHVDGIETLLGTIDADTGGILTAVQTLDNAISGNEMQVDVVASLPAGTATIGAVIPVPSTSGGLTIFRSLDIDETEEEVKATAGQIYGVWATNTATTTRWLKFYNLTAANTTVGSSTPLITIGIPGNSSDDISAMLSGAHGIAFSTAISVACTTAAADADTGAPGAGDVIINVFYA